MNDGVSVGLLDSGPGVTTDVQVHVASTFVVDETGQIVRAPAIEDPTGHGTAMARIITSQTPRARLLVAQVFSRPGAGSTAVVAAGLDWLIAEGAAAVSMSFGLRRDRDVLKSACLRALDKGAVLIASAPARGAMVYPAAYPGVISATGDARCAAGEVSHLESAGAEFGACPHLEEGNNRDAHLAGASCGAAYVSGAVARFLDSGGDPSKVRDHLQVIAQYHGPERRA